MAWAISDWESFALTQTRIVPLVDQAEVDACADWPDAPVVPKHAHAEHMDRWTMMEMLDDLDMLDGLGQTRHDDQHDNNRMMDSALQSRTSPASPTSPTDTSLILAWRTIPSEPSGSSEPSGPSGSKQFKPYGPSKPSKRKHVCINQPGPDRPLPASLPDGLPDGLTDGLPDSSPDGLPDGLPGMLRTTKTELPVVAWNNNKWYGKRLQDLRACIWLYRFAMHIRLVDIARYFDISCRTIRTYSKKQSTDPDCSVLGLYFGLPGHTCFQDCDREMYRQRSCRPDVQADQVNHALLIANAPNQQAKAFVVKASGRKGLGTHLRTPRTPRTLGTRTVRTCTPMSLRASALHT